MRTVNAFILALGVSACGQSPRVHEASPTDVAPTPVPFRAVRAPSRTDPAAVLIGSYSVFPDRIEVVVTDGVLHLTTDRRRIQDIRAGIATGDTTVSGGWNTPRLSATMQARALPLTADGEIRDTVRFVIKGTRGFRLGDFWLTFQLHGLLNLPAYGGWVEEVHWIQNPERFPKPQGS